jgi:hypothetical protein
LAQTGRRGLGDRLPNVASMTAQGPMRADETPRMLLVFEGMAPDEPIRPVQVATVLSALEEVFLVTLLRDAPPPDYRTREWVWDYDAQSMHVGLDGLRLESPLEILLALPWHVYTLPFSAFAYGVAHVFGAPAQAAPLFDRSREDFWSSRLAGGNPSAEWMEWQSWLEYKHEEVLRTVPFHLEAVDIEVTLPPEPDEPPD